MQYFTLLCLKTGIELAYLWFLAVLYVLLQTQKPDVFGMKNCYYLSKKENTR